MKATTLKKINNSEGKRERFLRIIERRVNKILDDFDSLGKCANKKNYEYREEEVRQIFITIDKKVKEIKLLYQNSGEKKEKFTLKMK